MKWRPPVLLFVGLCWASWSFLCRPFILLGENGVLDLVAFHPPHFYDGLVLPVSRRPDPHGGLDPAGYPTS